MAAEYPLREHLDAPQSNMDVLLQELAHYPTPQEMAQNIVVLREIYGETKLFKSFVSFAKRTSYAGRLTGLDEEELPDPKGHLFTAGCLMSLHSVNVLMDSHQRRYVLAADCKVLINEYEHESPESHALRTLAAEMDLRDFATKGRNHFAELNPDDHAALTLVAEAIVTGINPSNVDLAKECVLDGMSFGYIQIEHLLRNYNEKFPYGNPYTL